MDGRVRGYDLRMGVCHVDVIGRKCSLCPTDGYVRKDSNDNWGQNLSLQ